MTTRPSDWPDDWRRPHLTGRHRDKGSRGDALPPSSSESLLEVELHATLSLDDYQWVFRDACTLIERGTEPRILVLVHPGAHALACEIWTQWTAAKRFADGVHRVAIVSDDIDPEAFPFPRLDGSGTARVRKFPASELSAARQWLLE